MNDRFPDIEIYIKQPDRDALVGWLEGNFTVLDSSRRGDAVVFDLRGANGPSECVVVENAASGGYTSIWFKSSNTPWQTDRDCARQAFEHFGGETRCSLGSWREEQDEGQEQQKQREQEDPGWLSFTDAGERIIQWP